MLKKLEKLFKKLEDNKIEYVIWKSLENIDRALSGKDDLDILFYPKDYTRIKNSMKFLSLPEDYRSIGRIGSKLRVFRGIDEIELKPIMIHAHFECRFGSKKYKEFRFPKESALIKENKIYQGVKILKDEYFLLTRVLIAISKEQIDPFLANWLKELKNQEERVKQYEKVFNSAKINFIELVEKKRLQEIKKGLITSKILIKDNFFKILIRKISRIKIKISRNNKIGFKRAVVLRGGDGVGKSTLAKLLSDSLRPFAATKVIYLGRNRWSKFNDLVNKKRGESGLRFLNFFWPITSSTEILLRYTKGKIHSYAGKIVIYDRSLEDLKIKYKASNPVISWFPLLISKLSSGKDLKYLLYADPKVIKDRGDSHRLEELVEIQKRYLAEDTNFKKINTSGITPVQTASLIIQDTLLKAANEEDRL